MKETFKSLYVYTLIFYLILTLFEGVILPDNVVYVLATLIILSLVMMLAKPFLTFLTVKVNFLTMFLVGSILLFGSMFLLESLMPGFYVEEGVFSGFNFGSIVIREFEMTPIISMVCVSVAGSFMCSLFHELD